MVEECAQEHDSKQHSSGLNHCILSPSSFLKGLNILIGFHSFRFHEVSNTLSSSQIICPNLCPHLCFEKRDVERLGNHLGRSQNLAAQDGAPVEAVEQYAGEFQLGVAVALDMADRIMQLRQPLKAEEELANYTV